MTPQEAVAEAIQPWTQDDNYDALPAASAAIEALRESVRQLNPDHSPPSHSPTGWNAWCDGYRAAVNDILGEPQE